MAWSTTMQALGLGLGDGMVDHHAGLSPSPSPGSADSTAAAAGGDVDMAVDSDFHLERRRQEEARLLAEAIRMSLAPSPAAPVPTAKKPRPSPAAVTLRVIAQDLDPGIPGTSAQERSYRPSFDPAAPVLSPPVASNPDPLVHRSTATADLDGDGDMDLVSVNGSANSANGSANSLTLYFQTGPRVFAQAASTLPTGTDPRHVVAADLDGDGDVDLVSADFDSDSLTLFFQTNPGDFTQQPVTLAVGANPWAVTVADLDGDGDMDLAAANSGDSTLTLWLPARSVSPSSTTATTTVAMQTRSSALPQKSWKQAPSKFAKPCGADTKTWMAKFDPLPAT